MVGHIPDQIQDLKEHLENECEIKVACDEKITVDLNNLPMHIIHDDDIVGWRPVKVMGGHKSTDTEITLKVMCPICNNPNGSTVKYKADEGRFEEPVMEHYGVCQTCHVKVDKLLVEQVIALMANSAPHITTTTTEDESALFAEVHNNMSKATTDEQRECALYSALEMVRKKTISLSDKSWTSRPLTFPMWKRCIDTSSTPPSIIPVGLMQTMCGQLVIPIPSKLVKIVSMMRRHDKEIEVENEATVQNTASLTGGPKKTVYSGKVNNVSFDFNIQSSKKGTSRGNQKGPTNYVDWSFDSSDYPQVTIQIKGAATLHDDVREEFAKIVFDSKSPFYGGCYQNAEGTFFKTKPAGDESFRSLHGHLKKGQNFKMQTLFTGATEMLSGTHVWHLCDKPGDRTGLLAAEAVRDTVSELT